MKEPKVESLRTARECLERTVATQKHIGYTCAQGREIRLWPWVSSGVGYMAEFGSADQIRRPALPPEPTSRGVFACASTAATYAICTQLPVSDVRLPRIACNLRGDDALYRRSMEVL